MGVAKQKMGKGTQPQVSCVSCGAAIGRHEPLVIVDGGEVRRSTLAIESRPPSERAAIYHPGCFPSAEEERLPAAEDRRLFREALCGVDGGAGSFAAVEQAARLVGPGGALTVLVVTSLRTGVGQLAAVDAAEMTERASLLADQAGVSCTVEVDPARPAQSVIRDWAADHDLLAIGAPPQSVLAASLFGGVTETAMRSLGTPLLIARPAPAAARIGEPMLVASDGSPDSSELVTFASRLAGETGSKLTLVHATGRTGRARRSRVATQAQSIQLGGIQAAPAVIESGSAAKTIIDACERFAGTLVVMSSRRRSGMSAFGSVSRRIVHHGSCSVLLVPPERLHPI